ncbi:hypothetical protein ONR57_06545 [Hoyosella sp. YIM 151337]|uniref:hypothetical protein n=1 Tax=Hoyosella sp. YIM 151337 TaxID=2992742 RepID=UPI0022368C56|nr:hypothetical protein [Hoyosella sp. YIM 151337]MCW4352951.1 hypothetical protein [Hoyosella sp. YIM 151337]
MMSATSQTALTARHLMNNRIVGVPAHLPVTAALELMSYFGVSEAPIMMERRCIGLLVAPVSSEDPVDSSATAGECCSHGLCYVDADADAMAVDRAFAESASGAVLVQDHGCLVGVIKLSAVRPILDRHCGRAFSERFRGAA